MVKILFVCHGNISDASFFTGLSSFHIPLKSSLGITFNTVTVKETVSDISGAFGTTKFSSLLIIPKSRFHIFLYGKTLFLDLGIKKE